jgi:hypothetical protein
MVAAALLWSPAVFAGTSLERLPGYGGESTSRSPDVPALNPTNYQKRSIALGGWGQLELGQTEGPSTRLILSTPARPAAPVELGNRLNAKAAYYSPKLAGFQLGVSYAPMRVGYGADMEPARNMFEGAIRHETSLGKAKLRLTAGGGRARKRKDRAALHRSWTAGGQVALSGLTVGAMVRERIPVEGSRIRSWSTGLFYQEDGPTGGWSLGGRLERVAVGEEPALDAWSTVLRYRWSPKVTLSADLGTMAADGTPTDDTRILFGTRVQF